MEPEGEKLLWTGGWDSTFHLLDCVIARGWAVAPYYLINEGRLSLAVELRTLALIKEALRRDHPGRAHLLHDTRFFSVADLSPDPEVSAAYAMLRRRLLLGPQYEWLARFCRQHGIGGLRIGVHRDDKAHALLEGLVREDERTGGYLVDAAHRGTPEHVLFEHFLFPVFELSKLDMKATAERRGWGALMDLT